MNKRNILVLILGHITLGSMSPMIVLLNGFVGARLAPSEALATLAMGIMVAGTAFTTVPAARLAQRKGRRFGFLLAVITCFVGGLLSALAIFLESFVLYSSTALLFGVSMAFLLQFRFAAAENATSNKVSTAVALILFAGIGAAILGPRLGVSFAQSIDGVPYAGSYLAISAMALVAAGILVFYQDLPVYTEAGSADVNLDSSQGSNPEAKASYSQLWNGKYFLGVLCGATSFGVMALIMTATPISMHHHNGISLEDTATVIQLHIAAMFLPSLLTGYLIQRVGVQWVALVGLLCNLACVFMAVSGISYGHYLVALVLLGVGWNALFMAATHMIATCYPGPERFQAQALNDFIVFGCQGVASLSAGLLLAWIGWQSLNLVGLIVLLICLAAWLHLVFIKQIYRLRIAV